MACDDNLVNAAQLGEFLGLSSSNIRNLAEAGEVVRAPARGRYLLRESVQKYCEKLRVAANRSNTRGEATATLTNERARLAKEQADVMALKAAQARGELVPAAEVAQRWKTILSALRGRFLALPSRLRARLSLSRADFDVINDEIIDTLADLADG